MTNKLKILMVCMAFILAGGGVRAAGDVINSNTGEGSINNSDVTIENITKVENTNEGNVDNVVKVSMVTGENTASENTGEASPSNPADPDVTVGGKGGGLITTGDASLDIKISNTLNTNNTEVGAEEEVESGKGGAVAQPVTPGVVLTAAGTVQTLPSTGANFFGQLALLLGIPLMATLFFAAAGSKKRKLSYILNSI